jgi:hypothetical protein
LALEIGSPNWYNDRNGIEISGLLFIWQCAVDNVGAINDRPLHAPSKQLAVLKFPSPKGVHSYQHFFFRPVDCLLWQHPRHPELS